MSILIHTAPLPTGPYIEAIRTLAPELTFVEGARDLPDDILKQVQAVLAWNLPRGLIARLPALRWVCGTGAGVERLIGPSLPEHIPVSRIVDPLQAQGIAQYVTSAALRHARQWPLYAEQQREHAWKRHPMVIARHKVSVLGLGETGKAIAAMLSAVGFEVSGWRRSEGRPLADALRQAQIVVCALPLTAQTENILNAEAFAQMARGTYLINIARGGHVVEADLIAAVRSGQLSGATLDVQVNEPMPADDPLWDVPGIAITPHIAAQPDLSTIARQFVEGWRCIEAGRPPPRLVDRRLGY